MNIMMFAKTAMSNLFHKPVTRLYPQVPRIYPERTRGQISVNIDSCIFCGLCEKKCPSDAIIVDRVNRTWSIKRFGCIQCTNCIGSCNKGSLSMIQAYTHPGAVKVVDVYMQKPKEDVQL